VKDVSQKRLLMESTKFLQLTTFTIYSILYRRLCSTLKESRKFKECKLFMEGQDSFLAFSSSLHGDKSSSRFLICSKVKQRQDSVIQESHFTMPNSLFYRRESSTLIIITKFFLRLKPQPAKQPQTNRKLSCILFAAIIARAK
jgi:hypothetical protein